MVGPESSIVGPIPAGADPEDYDRVRRRILWLMPSGLYLLGSAAGGRRNLMTLNWATQVATHPKLLLVSVEQGALTHQLISEGGTFALSILRREDRAVVRKFVKPASDDGASLSGHPVWAAPSGAPVLSQALAWLDCAVRSSWELGSHTAFVGEVTACGTAPGAEGARSGGPGPERPGAGGARTGLPASGDAADVLRMEDTRMSYGG